MKTINKVLLSVATVTTVLAPLVPKNININVNLAAEAPGIKKERPYQIVDTQCDLRGTSITDSGMQVCEYACRGGDKITVYKTFRSNAMSCPKTTTERVKQTKR
jgi:hypothetical protein